MICRYAAGTGTGTGCFETIVFHRKNVDCRSLARGEGMRSLRYLGRRQARGRLSTTPLTIPDRTSVLCRRATAFLRSNYRWIYYRTWLLIRRESFCVPCTIVQVRYHLPYLILRTKHLRLYHARHDHQLQIVVIPHPWSHLFISLENKWNTEHHDGFGIGWQCLGCSSSSSETVLTALQICINFQYLIPQKPSIPTPSLF